MGDSSKFFATTKKGEIFELKEQLNDKEQSRRKDAVKKVIALMTVGKDVSMLFADVVNCIRTPNLELKKLVYLYLLNYAKSNPDLAIMAVNSFVMDAGDKNPLIRALAVRTMGCIRVDRITEYLAAPLKHALKDNHPYVRKTAAICVAKLYDINQSLVMDQGFIEILQALLSDSTPMVVANAVIALSEIQEECSEEVFTMNSITMSKMMSALKECTEWGQVVILDALSKCTPQTSADAETIIERVIPRLQHSNSAVVLSTIRVLLRCMEFVKGEESIASLCKKLTQPLVTLLSSEPEIQYVSLRNIELILQRWPLVLQNEIKVFFCKYNDPIYVKMEKLEIMIRLANDKNYEHVLMEFKEYASGVDVDFVRKAVHAIGRIAIKIDQSASSAVQVLLNLIQTRVNYVVQEAVSVIKNIFRKYPNQYESIIATLCENLDTLDEAEAKASMIWIIGEYSDRIDNADELLDSFVDSFTDESAPVQLQLLTAVVKLYLRRPEETQEMVEKVLTLSTQTTDNPDLRDRGYVYWRLCAADPEAARNVVFAEKPLISESSHNLSSVLLAELLENVSTLSSVYHKPPERFVAAMSAQASAAKKLERANIVKHMTEDQARDEETMAAHEEEDRDVTGVGGVGDLLDLGGMGMGGGGGGVVGSSMADIGSGGAAPDEVSEADMLGSIFGAVSPGLASGAAPATTTTMTSGVAPVLDLMGGGIPGAVPAAIVAVPKERIVVPSKVVLTAQKGKGIEVSCGWKITNDESLSMELTIANNTTAPLTNIAVQFNQNFHSIKNAAPLQCPSILPGARQEVSLPIDFSGKKSENQSPAVQVALRAMPVGVVYFQDFLMMNALFLEKGDLEKSVFLDQWKSIPDANEMSSSFTNLPFTSIDETLARLQENNMFFIARRKAPNGTDFAYLSCKTLNDHTYLVEVSQPNGENTATLSCRSTTPENLQLLMSSLKKLLFA